MEIRWLCLYVCYASHSLRWAEVQEFLRCLLRNKISELSSLTILSFIRYCQRDCRNGWYQWAFSPTMTRVDIFHILWGSKNNVKMRICTEYSSRLVFYCSESFVYTFARICWQTPVSSSKGDNVWRGEGGKCTMSIYLRYHMSSKFKPVCTFWSQPPSLSPNFNSIDFS